MLAICACQPVHAFGQAATAALVLKDHSTAAVGLFNNMRTPAALIGGALVPLGILNAPPVAEDDSKRTKLFKRAYILMGVGSLLSEILAVTYSTIAINKLVEVAQAPTAGVAELIANYHEIAWIGTNIHFLFGMMGFGLIVGARASLLFGNPTGKIAGLWSVAAFMQALSVVNRGIAQGNGAVEHSQFASNMFTLTLRYGSLLLANARGVMSISAVAVFLYSLVLLAKAILKDTRSDEKKRSK
jgi:hypothetical protein